TGHHAARRRADGRGTGARGSVHRLAGAVSMTRLSSSTPLVKLAGGALVLGAWEIVVRLFAPAYVARPSNIARALPQALASAGMLRAAGVTLRAVVEGLLIAVLSGTLIGLAMGRARVVDRLLELYGHGRY